MSLNIQRHCRANFTTPIFSISGGGGPGPGVPAKGSNGMSVCPTVSDSSSRCCGCVVQLVVQ